MKGILSTVILSATLAVVSTHAKAASFDCTSYEDFNAAEQRICDSPMLGALDERLDSWYRRALLRAQYFDQTSMIRDEQRAWIDRRNACGANNRCISRVYRHRIHELAHYVEHV